IPGLIEGAHRGKGLGYDFLRHVSRNRVLIHMLDGTDPEVTENYKKINNELKKYDKELGQKPQLVVINKIDSIKEEDLKKIKKNLEVKTIEISAVTGAGIPKLISETEKLLGTIKKPETTEETHKIFRPHIDNRRFEIEEKKKKFIVKGRKIEQLAIMTNFTNEQGLQRVYHHMNISGIEKALQKSGAKEGDIVKIGEKELKFTKWED
ncbi:Obg family GTPase CgtA, partial [Patescibacteria group bacterium]|nr:Obg family GTPase CgtA [Patescibacteria group bacterium]